MLQSKFIGTVLVIILGVNVGAWTLSIATTSVPSAAPISIPISVPISTVGIDAQSEAASVELTQSPVMNDAPADYGDSATTTASSSQGW